MEGFSVDVDVITHMLREKYPNDDIIVQWNENYFSTYYQLVKQCVWHQTSYNENINDIKMEFNELNTECNKLCEVYCKNTLKENPSTSKHQSRIG